MFDTWIFFSIHIPSCFSFEVVLGGSSSILGTYYQVIFTKKALRPNGATKDSLTLGNKRPSVGPETSRKVFKVLTTLDPTLEI